MLLKEFLKSFKRRYTKLLSLFFVLLIATLSVFAYSFFKIKNVSCLSATGPCDEEVLLVLNRYRGTSAFVLSKQLLIQELSKIRPVKSLAVHYQLFGNLKIKLETEESFRSIRLVVVKEYPTLSFNKIPESTDTAVLFKKPSQEILDLENNFSYVDFKLWYGGEITPISSDSSKIIFFFKDKPNKEEFKSIYNLLEIVDKYITLDWVYILGKTVFLSRDNQPDIITSVQYNEDQLVEALQSLSFLTTMKKDPKTIDLRFKNPIIR